MTISGHTATWCVAGNNGNQKAHAFCPTCGAQVYLTLAAAPDIVAVHAGSLDDPSQFTPQLVTYGVSACSWDTVTPGVAVFDRMPTP